MTEIEKLKAVLDMTEAESVTFVANYIVENNSIKNAQGFANDLSPFSWASNRRVFADLAFRFRDEWTGKIFSRRMFLQKGLKIVWEYESKKLLKSDSKIAFDYWICLLAQPIHWIIASLIAKQLAKKQ